MINNKKNSPVFRTEEQEKLFFECALESMLNLANNELLIDESSSCEKVRVCSVFKTKEQEKLFFECALESMHKHMSDELSCDGKKKVLKK